jgi:uncharacterized protein
MSIEEKILNTNHVVAIVGLSPKTDKPSYRVASYLMEQGYRVIPVNPGAQEILGEVCYPDLSSISEPIDIVDIFRNSEEVPAIVKEAIGTGAKVIWMQEGVKNEGAAEMAKQAGLLVVMDKCIKKTHQSLKG